MIGALVLAAAVIGTRWGVFTPDTRPDLYQNPGGFLRSTVQAWVGGSSGLGQGNFNAGAAPVAAVVWVIRTLGAPAWMAVRVWRLALLLLGAWGIRRYLGALMGRRLSVGARVLATVFWVVNPYVIVAGSTTPILLPYALLPWTMLAFLRATRSPRSWRWPALFALAFFAQTGLNAGVVPFFQLLALPAQVAFARWVEGRSWRDLLRVVVRCGAFCVAVSLYWLLPSLLASGTGAGIAAVTERPVDVARTSSYAETARGLGNWPLYGRAGDREFLGDYTIYLTSPIVLLCTFLVPVLVGTRSGGPGRASGCWSSGCWPWACP
ncbi:alpha-(1-_3)-arabinofuranosyltransferase family protein [Aquihabitans daechungensis]|uniref:alpha-(1->3)-arabinofuranosyltransferase domain-containing protein n=1 Tax=Aquihabitans daechungensis TaxID=1052257 RepID=UPI003B9E2658